MSGQPNDGQSLLGRGCFLSGVVTVLVIIALKRFAFRLPFLWVLILAGGLWLFFFMIVMRRAR